MPIRAAQGGAERVEVIMKVSAWAASAAAIGLAAALAGCAGSAPTTVSANSPAARASGSPASSSPATASPATASPASSVPAATVPAGYRRVSDPALGISFAVPDSWATVNLAKETVQRAAQRLGLQGVSAEQLTQDMQSLQKLHALFVVDVKSAADSSAHFATTLDAYCVSSGVTDTGTAGLPLLRQEAAVGMRQVHAGHIAQKDIAVGGVPGVRTSYTLSYPNIGTLEGQQLEVEPKPDRVCFLSLAAPARQFPAAVLPVVAATTVFS